MQLWLAFVFLTGVGYALAFSFSGSVFAPMLANIAVTTALLYARIHPEQVGALTVEAIGKIASVCVICILLGLIPRKDQDKSERRSETNRFNIRY